MSSCVVYFDFVKVRECTEFSFISNDLNHSKCKHYKVVDLMNYQDATNNFFHKHGTVRQVGDSVVYDVKIFREDVTKHVKEDLMDHRIVYTYGKEKAKHLARMINRHVIDLQDLGCPSVNVLKIDEDEMNTHTVVSLLSAWCRENRATTDLMRFDARLKTFKKFPHNNVDFNDMAKTGLIYTFEEDRATCVICHIVLEEWKIDDEPSAEHQRYNIRCSFLRNIPDDILRGTRSYCC
jgi:hypothetical protein